MKMVDDRPRKGEKVGKETPQLTEGYYPSDKNNPNLKKFVEDYLKERDYDPKKDDYEVIPLLKSSKVKRTTKIFNMHTYWSKKPHESIQSFIENYTEPGDLILDPFCGSGGTLLVSAISGRKGIGIDISPSAIFLSSTLCSPPRLEEFQSNFNNILSKLRSQYSWLYKIPYNGRISDIHFGISSMIFECSKCMEKVSYYRCIEEGKIRKCPFCGEPIKTNQKKLGYQLNEWHIYSRDGSHDIVRLDGVTDDYEYSIMKRISEELNEHKPPEVTFLDKGVTQRLGVRGIKTYSDLYTPRNLLALCLYRDECFKISDLRLRNSLLFILTACSLKTSRMMGLNSDGIGRIQKNGLIAQLIVKDVNVFDFLEIAFKGIYSGYSEIISKSPLSYDVIFSTQSSVDLAEIPSSSVDYIFTDPPYGGRVQFWESNLVWEGWLNFESDWSEKELIVNKFRDLSEKHWEDIFEKSMKECYRVLKEGRWITLTYNDRETWPLLQNIMLNIGFVPDTSDKPIAIETTAKSEKQLKGENNTLRDLVVNFKKPKTNDYSYIEFELKSSQKSNITFNEKATSIIRSELILHPGQNIENLHDIVISKMVRSGELETANISSLVATIAEEIPKNSNRWYLNDNDSELISESELEKEGNVATIIENYINLKTNEEPSIQGLKFNDLYEFYLYSIKNSDKPRRPLHEWLNEYFFINDDMTYRPPLNEEECEKKRLSRFRGLNHKITKYIDFIEKELAIPGKFKYDMSTLAEWIHHCRRSGLYDKGKILYERGGISFDRLSEEQQIEVEENYQACIRALEREASMISGKINSKSNK